ncbi:MAG TPA: hypothetical protein VN175_12755 [Rhizomicrobium sp.]|jgi:hypothetical protein|nr:hypothetical protein [Rhizomicrobium sp.]
MTTLGEILQQLQDPLEIRRLMMEAGDIAMAARLDKLAFDQKTDAGAAALQAVDSFTRRADDEAWVKLIGHIQDAEVPAAACLSEMLRWAQTH